MKHSYMLMYVRCLGRVYFNLRNMCGLHLEVQSIGDNIRQELKRWFPQESDNVDFQLALKEFWEHCAKDMMLTAMELGLIVNSAEEAPDDLNDLSAGFDEETSLELVTALLGFLMRWFDDWRHPAPILELVEAEFTRLLATDVDEYAEGYENDNQPQIIGT